MALGSFVAGASLGTYTAPSGAAQSMGIMESGYEIQCRALSEILNSTDQYGESVIDGIFRGTECHVQATGIEWTAGLLKSMMCYGATFPASGAGYFGPGVIGRLNSDVAGSIILSTVAATPAATAPASLTVPLAIIAEGFDVSWALNSKLRKMPARWRALLANISSTMRHFSVT